MAVISSSSMSVSKVEELSDVVDLVGTQVYKLLENRVEETDVVRITVEHVTVGRRIPIEAEQRYFNSLIERYGFSNGKYPVYTDKVTNTIFDFTRDIYVYKNKDIYLTRGEKVFLLRRLLMADSTGARRLTEAERLRVRTLRRKFDTDFPVA